jgi:ABC-type nitrate/sulfonate/bicarbonate transport system substrate-binding protein
LKITFRQIAGVLSCLALAACGGASASTASGSAAASGVPAAAASHSAAAEAKPAGGSSAAGSTAASQGLTKLKIAYASPSAGFWTVYMAKDGGYFEKHGLDVTLTRLASNLMVPAILSGEVDAVDLAAGGLVPAVLAGADLTMVVSDTTPTLQALAAQQGIDKITDLKGQVVVFSGPGTSDDFLMRRMLAMNNMQAGKDVTLLNSGGAPETLAMLTANRGVAGMMTPPTVFKAGDIGMHVIARPNDLFPYQGSGIIFRTARLATPAGADVATRIAAAMVEGVQRLHSDRAFATQVLMKYADGTTQQVANQTWDFAVPNAPADGYPTKEGFRLVIDDLKSQYQGKTLPDVDSLLDLKYLDAARAAAKSS